MFNKTTQPQPKPPTPKPVTLWDELSLPAAIAAWLAQPGRSAVVGAGVVS
jgi:hypothetical protein